MGHHEHYFLFAVAVLDLLDERPKFLQRGGIGVLDGVEHWARQRQRRAAMILLADDRCGLLPLAR